MRLYFSFKLSPRDVEDLLTERGIDLTYETVRCSVNKFGPAIAANIRPRRKRPACVWHLDEVVVRIEGKHRRHMKKGSETSSRLAKVN